MAPTLFISYSRADMQDTDWLARFRMYLTPFRRAGSVDVWDDSRIAPGSMWRDEITRALARAAAAVLLVGPGFLASDFVINHELPALLESARRRGVTLFPLVVGFCGYGASELSAYQSFNAPDHPLESLTRSEQNRILNAMAAAVDGSLRSHAPSASGQPTTESALYQKMSAMQRRLTDTLTAFHAQRRRRNDLVAAIEKRLEFTNTLSFEKFFLRYCSELTTAERFEFDQIRAMTDGVLQPANRAILEIIEGEPAILELMPNMPALRQHLVFWLNKYDRIFVNNPAMCLLYTGVEDGVPFPPGVDDAVNAWLAAHKP